MKKISFLIIALMCIFEHSIAQKFERQPFGVKFESSKDSLISEVKFYSPSIVRIVKYPLSIKALPSTKSYSVILNPQNTKINYQENGEEFVMSSTCFKVVINKKCDNISFYDLEGNNLLKEKNSSFLFHHNDADTGLLKISQAFLLDKDEAIFGLGQRQCNELNQRGQNIRIWSGNTNITIPYFTSEKGYGLYWDNAGESYFNDNQEQTMFSSEVAKCIDYYLIYKDGTQDGVIAGIRQLTGQATMFPLWTMGYWQCRERYKSSDELCDVLDKYRELHIPLDGIVQDWQYWGCDSNWNAMRFMNPHYINKMGDAKWAKYLPNDEHINSFYKPSRIKTPEEMVKYVHEKNAHLMISIWSSFGPWTKQFNEMKKIDALLPFETWPRKSGVRPYDPFNPNARDIYWKYLSYLYKMGFDAWWTDSTEPDHFEKPGDSNYKTYDGTWRSVKNAFPLVANKGIYEHQRAMKGNIKRSVQMTRCAAFGIQHYGTFSWSGDIVSNWKVMKNQIPSGLNYVICGIPFWNTDIGGFFGWEYNNDPKNIAMQELQVRWMQWGCFMPIMRNHCSSPMVNELYNYGSPGDWAFDVQKEYIELRYRLLPYIYSNAGDVVLNSGSMMRALVMDFAKDKKAVRLNDEYIFGRSLLVKPVTDPLYTWKDEHTTGHSIYPDVTKGSAPISIYLPSGNDWYDFWTNEKFKGGKNILKPCPIQTIPVYVKSGSIIPFGPTVQYSNEKLWDNLEIRIYPGNDGNFTLYEDEGDNYNYEKGDFTTIEFHWNDAKKILTINNRKGTYKGMLTNRKFNIILVDSNTNSGEKEALGKVIDYSGEMIQIPL